MRQNINNYDIENVAKFKCWKNKMRRKIVKMKCIAINTKLI